MPRYNLKIELESSVSFIDPIYFDSLLTFLWLKDVYGFVPTPLNLERENIIYLPSGLLTEHDEGFYKASYMMLNKHEGLEYVTYFTKHFHTRDVHLAKFKGVRKIQTNKGKYKSYQLPIILHNIKQVYFTFETENITAVCGILERQLYSIGKKRNRGWGLIKRWKIEETQAPIRRFMPLFSQMDQKDKPQKNQIILYLRKKPPYWSQVDAVPCVEGELCDLKAGLK